jgi:2-octaprenyl-6-methoxyphenol hydroxylase
MPLQHDFAIIGSGPVGLATALALAKQDYDIALIAPKTQKFDAGRTAALMAPALDLLAGLLPITVLEAIGATLDGIRIIDVTGALFRAPTVTFRSSEIGLDRFGLNLPNDALVAALAAGVEASDRIEWINSALVSLADHPQGYGLQLDNGEQLSVPAVIGKRSSVRQGSAIAVREWTYPQSALTFHVRHQRDHLDLSTEFHTREGPLTFVPLADGLCSVVWMMRPQSARARLDLSDEAFAKDAQSVSQAFLGKLTLASKRALIPMSGLKASAMAKGRVALIGEAAHAFPPIGAQGLNLGMRDLRDLITALQETSGTEAAFARYARMRQADVMLRTTAVDAMNRSLLAGFLPFDAMRSLGMSAISGFSPLRRAVMRAGIGDWANLLPRPPYGNRSAGR